MRSCLSHVRGTCAREHAVIDAATQWEHTHCEKPAAYGPLLHGREAVGASEEANVLVENVACDAQVTSVKEHLTRT